jgi:hypothetical protein
MRNDKKATKFTSGLATLGVKTSYIFKVIAIGMILAFTGMMIQFFPSLLEAVDMPILSASIGPIAVW